MAQEIDPRLRLQSVARAFHVLEVIGNAGYPLSLAEIARLADIDKSAAQRIANTLLSLGYLERSTGATGYVPGRRLLERAFDFLRFNPIVERATPLLIELRKTCRERVDFSLIDGTMIVYAVRLQSKRENFYATLIGRRLPAYSSSGGRAMMALMPDDEVDAVLQDSEMIPFTPRTVHDIAGVKAKIEEARRDGYALAVEESLLGEVVLAAAVRDAVGRPLGAVHIAGSLSEWSPEDFAAKFSPLAMATAHALNH